jgi:spermidine synthase
MITNHSMNTNTNDKIEAKKELLKEIVQNDPYIAFFIPFFHDMGIEPLLASPFYNPHTKTKILAIDKRTIVIEQDNKRLEIRIKDAKKILEDTYGPFPLIID